MHPSGLVTLVFLILVIVQNGLAAKCLKKRSSKRSLFWREEAYSTPLECARQCRDGDPPKICYYHFTLELYTTNGWACDLCTPNSTNTFTADCQCILGDGVERTAVVANRMLPGPSIQVCLNDKVVIDVENHVKGFEVTIHWHGIWQRGSPYSDGTPYVTQCPIHEGNTFRYQFIASNGGTHFWHAHTGLQKLNGLFGSVVVREPPSEDPQTYLYDYDEVDHVILLNDWMHDMAEEHFPGKLRFRRGQDPDSIMINGKGQTINPYTDTLTNITLERFVVMPGKRYRFRMINSLASVCPAQLTVQGHVLTLIATDGEPVKPVKINSIVSTSGERYDFVLTANQNSGSYWIQVKALGECGDNRIQQLGVLNYEAVSQSPIAAAPSYDKALPVGVLINPLFDRNKCDGSSPNTVCINQLVNAREVDSRICNNAPTVSFNVSFRFKDFSLEENYQPGRYQTFMVPPPVEPPILPLASVLNNISFVYPPSPLLSQYNDINPQMLCNANRIPAQCRGQDYCYCTNIVSVPYNGVVEIIIVDQMAITNLSHPFHLHGNAFYVVAIGQLPTSTPITVKHVHDMDSRGLIRRCSQSLPPRKDTIAVPFNGYVIIRFIANNPGYWFFHCHFLYHIATGMNMVIRNEGILPPVPAGFPKCGNFLPGINSDPTVI